MAEQLAPGTWELEKSENFDEYMKVLGVGYATRMIGNKVKPKQIITIESGLWTIVTSSTFTKTEIKFKLGEQFDETTADGRHVKTTCSVNGSKLLQAQKGDIDSLLVRDFSKDSFVMTLTAKDVTCIRYYKKVS